MAEYIDREAAKRAVELAMDLTDTEYDVICNQIDQIPASDVAPVVHGRWEDVDWCEMDEYGKLKKTSNTALRCTNCKNCFEKRALWKENYCPNCGAKMDGGDADENRDFENQG